MKFTVRIDATTLYFLIGGVLALVLLHDIHARHRAASLPTVASSGVQERVVTKEFVLVDDSGNTRARIGMNELNAPAVTLYDQTGGTRALLRLNQNDVPSLRLFDANGTLREGMGFAQGTLDPHLWFFDQNGATSELIPNTDSPTRGSARFSSDGSRVSNLYLYRGTTHQNTIQWDAKTVPGEAWTGSDALPTLYSYDPVKLQEQRIYNADGLHGNEKLQDK